MAADSLDGIASLILFGVFSAIHTKHLDYNVLFTSLSTLYLMLNPLITTIQMLPQLYGGYVSAKRIADFCRGGEGKDVQPVATSLDFTRRISEKNEMMLCLSNASFQWANGKSLAGLTFSLKRGQIALVRGGSGSGKSTLLRGLLSELLLVDGAMSEISGPIAYCAQTPWLLNVTIRDNIVLGKGFSPSLYGQIVSCCCLEEDLCALPAGDLTVVGFNGSRLSGGQRKRVALARALYLQSDLMLLDDIFSGLDGRLADIIRSRLFGVDGFLRLNGRTTIIITAEGRCTRFYLFLLT
jgi:ABC-type multidrug transport system fused ATPase/permease subunit